MKKQGSIKIERDATGTPWLVVGTGDDYVAQRITVTETHVFDYSWQAVKFIREHNGGEVAA
jgi:hypothetical protein